MPDYAPHRPDNLYDELEGGECVALSMDVQRVMAHDHSFELMKAKLKEQGVTKYVLDVVPPKDQILVL